MRQSILFCLFSVLILMMSACAAPQLKKDDLLFEPLIDKGISDDKPVILCVENFGFAKTIPDPSIVGEARIGMFNAPASILSQEPVHLIITGQMKKALLKAGFKLDEKENAHFTISGRVERFWVNERLGGMTESAKASVKYDLIIKDKQGRFVWGDNIIGKATSAKTLDATKNDVPTLVNALKNSIESIFISDSFWKAVKP
jgi:uncharacterized lipoprotein YajG